jgi:leukotriene-A4 hydrolase
MDSNKQNPCSLSNYQECSTIHTELWLNVSFAKSSLSGNVELTLQSSGGGLREIVLDTSYLNINSVAAGGKDVEWSVGDRVEPYGSPLKIQLESELGPGDKVVIRVCSLHFSSSTV